MKIGFKMLAAFGAAMIAAGRAGVGNEGFGVPLAVVSGANGNYKPQGSSRVETKKAKKTNKNRCKHNAKLKRRKG